ncbi:MAG: hypothetical protein GJV46_06040 [Geobacter sp.]|nr:hypothetical protein [Geobacter sp.]
MSSSRVIKALQHDGAGITGFSFRPIESAAASKSHEPASGGFVPMELFSGANLADKVGSKKEESEDTGPPMLQMTEDDFNQKINDSFNAGLLEGKNLTERGLVNVFRTLRGASETIHNLREKVLRESEDELINLVMLVARKVIIREVSQDRCILADVVKNALAGLSAREEVTIRLNPDDYALLTTGREECLKKELSSDRLQLKADSTVVSGFCLVDAAMGTVDANLSSQLETIYRNLLEDRAAATVQNN